MFLEDEEIIRLYFQRDESAIAKTAEKYGKYCSRVAMNILNNPEDVEECVNDTYLNTWNTIPPQKPNIFKAFLGKITRNISINLYKKKKTDKRGGGELSLVFEELEECIDTMNSPESELDRKEIAEAVNSFLASLPMKKRAIFVCRYWYAESIADIAQKYGISENAAGVMLNRLRKKLRIHLTERGIQV